MFRSNPKALTGMDFSQRHASYNIQEVWSFCISWLVTDGDDRLQCRRARNDKRCDVMWLLTRCERPCRRSIVQKERSVHEPSVRAAPPCFPSWICIRSTRGPAETRTDQQVRTTLCFALYFWFVIAIFDYLLTGSSYSCVLASLWTAAKNLSTALSSVLWLNMDMSQPGHLVFYKVYSLLLSSAV